MIYFIQEESTCNIKIGFSDSDPMGRNKTLQTGNSSELYLLLAIEGDRKDEKQLHQLFAEARIHPKREWFKPIPSLILFIVQNQFRNCRIPSAPVVLANGQEQRLYMSLVSLLEKHGPMVFSLRGPLGTVIHDYVQERASELWQKRGEDALERVFDAVEDYACSIYSEIEACTVGGALDHRFDGIGGWRC